MSTITEPSIAVSSLLGEFVVLSGRLLGVEMDTTNAIKAPRQGSAAAEGNDIVSHRAREVRAFDATVFTAPPQ